MAGSVVPTGEQFKPKFHESKEKDSAITDLKKASGRPIAGGAEPYSAGS